MKQTDKKTKKIRTRGVGIIDPSDNSFEFTPYEQGEPAQRNVKTTKGGKVYETCSEKKPLKVAYLTCAADAADPVAAGSSNPNRTKPPYFRGRISFRIRFIFRIR